MRILYIVHQFFPTGYTGTERFVLDLAKYMTKLGHSAEVLTYGIEEDISDYINNDDFLYKHYYVENIPVTAIKYSKIPEDLNTRIFNIKIDNILRKFITKEKFDMIHIAHPMRLGYAIKVAYTLKIPMVLTLTDFWLLCPRGIFVNSNEELCNYYDASKCSECLNNSTDSVNQRFNDAKEIFSKVDSLISATIFLKQIFAINGFPNVELIRFGIDYKNVQTNTKKYNRDSSITIGFLSSLNPHKGAHTLIEAFKMVDRSDIKLKIYGDYFGNNKYFAKLKNISDNDSNIEFYGKYKQEDMADILNKLDILVVPSLWWENSPLVLLNALAHRVPSIVSDLGGMKEVIKHAETGFTFKAGDPESLAKTIQLIRDDPSILNKIKANIQRPPRIEEEAFNYEKVYSRIIRNSI